MSDKVQLSDAEWQAKLSPIQFKVLRQKGLFYIDDDGVMNVKWITSRACAVIDVLYATGAHVL